MQLFKIMRDWQIRRRFASCGTGCTFYCRDIDLDGHVSIGDACILHNNLVLRTHKEGRIVLGNRVVLDHYVVIQANGRVEIAEDCYIGPYSVLRDTNRSFYDTSVHWRLTPHLTKPIIIGAGAYIAARAYIMPGVTIGEGAAIGPASVVTRDIPPNEIWAGNPARLIAHRTDPKRRARLKRDLALASVFGLPLEEEDTLESPREA